jgi:nicotinamidase-related amidase
MEQNKQNTALLVMDMQTVILDQIPDTGAVISSVAQAIDFARRNQVPVVYVTLAFRPGAPEISPANKAFMAARSMLTQVDPANFAAIHPTLAPRDNEPIVIKRRVSAFTGSDLYLLLQTLDIRQLVLTGIATSGVVLSTLREAADKDYRITVLADCCADRDEELHQVLLTKVFPRQADVCTVAEWSGSSR